MHNDNKIYNPGTVIIQSGGGRNNQSWLHFHTPAKIIQARTLDRVAAALEQVESAVNGGYHAAGFVSYEAAPAFDESFAAKSPGALPLLWFGLYKDANSYRLPVPGMSPDLRTIAWKDSVSIGEYRESVKRIREYIARGDTYQVNYTIRLLAEFHGDPYALFNQLLTAQRAQYAAYIDTGDHAICSVSPELFFTLSVREITCMPMKGTAPRGLTCPEDEERACELQNSVKNRAENVMVVDMLRNDLGRIAVPGSVQVPQLFSIERYSTLLQMTSTVTAKTDESICNIFKALFPCASITGAPKIRTMQIIDELESGPRGIYTGAIGYMAPGRRARFSVAIRTAHFDRAANRIEYGTGGGIVWDSTDEQEFQECRTKARILFESTPDFRLLETILWQPGKEFFLLDSHLKRLRDSAGYFGFYVDVEEVKNRLREKTCKFSTRHRVRLQVSRGGGVSIDCMPLEAGSLPRVWRVALARKPIDACNRFLYHKTTNRKVYDDARSDFPDLNDVILWNGNGEVTESTMANVVIKNSDGLVTPPVSCGLLGGTYRSHLIQSGRIREEIITLDDLKKADAVYLVNSVRGWIPTVPG